MGAGFPPTPRLRRGKQTRPYKQFEEADCFSYSLNSYSLYT